MRTELVKKTGVYLGISFGVFLIISFISDIVLSERILLSMADPSEVLFAQISNTFIVLSLMGVLSTNIGTIYWEDIKDIKLVSPFYYCFFAFTVYLLCGLIFSIISWMGEYYIGLYVSFVLSILLLVALTMRMMGVYFDDESIRDELKWKYRLAMLDAEYSYYEYERQLNKLRELVDPKDAKNVKELETRYQKFLEIDQSEYYSHIPQNQVENYSFYQNKIKEKTIQALNQNDFTVVNQNMDMLMEVQDSKTFMQILDAIIVSDPEFATTLLLKSKDKYNATVKNEISRIAKNILHNLSGKSCSVNMIQKLVWTIKPNVRELDGYHHFLEQMKSMEKEAMMIESEFLSVDVGELHDDDFKRFVKMEGHHRKEQKRAVIEFLSSQSGLVVGEHYKPVYELYDAYLKKDINLMLLYLDIIKDDKELIRLEFDGFIRGYVDSYEMDYLSVELEDVIQMILEQEKQNRILPERIRKEIQNISKIRF